MTTRPLALVLAIALGACQAQQQPVAEAAAPAVAASEALDKLDARIPVPLLPMMAQHQKQNMRDHLAVVQEVVAALARKDFPAIEKSAGRMGYSETMGQMCTHMGAGAAGFSDRAVAFHKTADEIARAASQREPEAVAAALTETLSACTACHAKYKQRIVDEATWASLTGGAPGPAHLSHQ